MPPGSRFLFCLVFFGTQHLALSNQAAYNEVVRILKQTYGPNLPNNISSVLTSPTFSINEPVIVYSYPPNCECKHKPDLYSDGIIIPSLVPKGIYLPLPSEGSRLPASPDPKSPELFGCLWQNLGPFPDSGSAHITDGIVKDDGNRLSWEIINGTEYPIVDGKIDIGNGNGSYSPILGVVGSGTFEVDQFGNKFWIDPKGRIFWIGPDGYILVVPFIYIPGKFFVYADTKNTFWIDEFGNAYSVDEKGYVKNVDPSASIAKGHFTVDDTGRYWFVDNVSGQKHFIDYNGNIVTIGYQNNDNSRVSILFPGKFYIDSDNNQMWIDYESRSTYFVDPDTHRIMNGRGTMRVEKGTFLMDSQGQIWWQCGTTKNMYMIDSNGNILSYYKKAPPVPEKKVYIYVDDQRRLCVMEPNRTLYVLPANGPPIQEDNDILIPEGQVIVSYDKKIYYVVDGYYYLIRTDGKVNSTSKDERVHPVLAVVNEGYFVVDEPGYVYWVSRNGYYFLISNYGFITKSVVTFPGRLVITAEGNWFWAHFDGKLYEIVDKIVPNLHMLAGSSFGFDANGYYMEKDGERYKLTNAGFVIYKTIENLSEVYQLPLTSPQLPPTTEPTIPTDLLCPLGTKLASHVDGEIKCETQPIETCPPGFYLSYSGDGHNSCSLVTRMPPREKKSLTTQEVHEKSEATKK